MTKTVTTTTTVETERGNSSPNQGKLNVSGGSWISKSDFLINKD